MDRATGLRMRLAAEAPQKRAESLHAHGTRVMMHVWTGVV